MLTDCKSQINLLGACFFFCRNAQRSSCHVPINSSSWMSFSVERWKTQCKCSAPDLPVTRFPKSSLMYCMSRRGGTIRAFLVREIVVDNRSSELDNGD